jgi:hypothetical protein
VPFLRPERDWERIDIYVPRDPPSGRLPCVVLFYGGGWGGKVMGGVAGEIEPLLEKGYVVAVPDYVLGASNPVPLAVWDGAEAIRFAARSQEPVTWFVAGKLGDRRRQFNPPREIPWLAIDADSGRLHGTPPRTGVYPLIVTASTGQEADLQCDARQVIITVRE